MMLSCSGSDPNSAASLFFILFDYAQVLENGMQCLRHYHLEVKRELHGGSVGRFDAEEWRASRERVRGGVVSVDSFFFENIDAFVSVHCGRVIK